jgi:hypothetical protein
LHFKRVVFKKPGIYDVSILAAKIGCVDARLNLISISTEPLQNNLINEFSISPNPSCGNFKTEIALNNASEITLKLISLATGKIMDIRYDKGLDHYSILYENVYTPGAYLLYLLAGNERRTLTLIVQ